ncbi:hypothetical protein Bca52824_002145 [Brassica carinata]|uniref:NAC domain-containing protein n=1 Tax=Brassica carinata TaxID=52824 RepID=A0A8X7WKL7_BRACI|nr:hypothetical protein Bca52824_002145 [Brassica carinata]
METSKVGFRFCPTDVELIKYYLKNKIQGKSWLVDDTIREVKICSYKPASLPALSMIKSKDLVWYFISPKEYTSPKKNVRKRTTPSGFWKATGKDRNVKEDKRRNSVVIGIKKTLVYYEHKSSNAVRTPWTMHEYHITCLPLLDGRTYVICKIFYKGNVEDIQSGSIVGAANTPPLVEQTGEENISGFSVTMLMNKKEDICPWDVLYPIPNMQLQAPFLVQDDDDFLGALTHVNRKHVDFLFTDDQELIVTQENCEEYMLKWLC